MILIFSVLVAMLLINIALLKFSATEGERKNW